MGDPKPRHSGPIYEQCPECGAFRLNPSPGFYDWYEWTDELPDKEENVQIQRESMFQETPKSLRKQDRSFLKRRR